MHKRLFQSKESLAMLRILLKGRPGVTIRPTKQGNAFAMEGTRADSKFINDFVKAYGKT
jgi:hypothetical protein